MASPLSQDARCRQLQQLATEWGLRALPSVTLRPRPNTSPLMPILKTANDDSLAEDLLKRRRQDAEQGKSQSRLRRSFTSSKRKSWDPQEIYDALEDHVAGGGSPGVAEALVLMLSPTGASPANTKPKMNLLTRRKSIDSMPRSQILLKAVRNRQTDMVTVLVNHADPMTLDEALPIAIDSRKMAIIELLLQYGANVSANPKGQEAFRQLCSDDGQADLVGLILQSNPQPDQSLLSAAMADAARNGRLDTVLRLSRSAADGNYRNAEALQAAVTKCRVDIALAILTGSKPPMGQGLSQAFTTLFDNNSMHPNDKKVLAQALLLAGASGDAVSAALVKASEAENYEMVQLLVNHGAYVDYQDAIALRRAISKGQTALVDILLTENTVLSRTSASVCVQCMPKNMALEDRHALLAILLRKGAAGVAIDSALIDAVKTEDFESVKVLLMPDYPRSPNVGGRSPSSSPRSMQSFSRRETASVDYRDGEALSIAVRSGNIDMVKQLLSAKPSAGTLDKVFPQLQDLRPSYKHRMTEIFLVHGFPAPCVAATLHQAIADPRRDERYVDLLLAYADVNSNNGAVVRSAVTHEDVPLLEKLLKKRPSLQTAASGISAATGLSNLSKRYSIVNLLLGVGVGRETIGAASEVLVHVLQTKPVDVKLLDLLLEHGKADVNFDGGAPLIHAAHNPDPSVLDRVLAKGSNAAQQNLIIAFDAIADQPTSPAKAAKIMSILRRVKPQASMDTALVKEVRSAVKTPLEPRELGIIQALLAAGADVNAQKAAALQTAVASADAAVSDLLLSARPVPASLATALPHALHIMDPRDRLNFTRKLIDAGAPASNANEALQHAIKKYPDDIDLLQVLATRAILSDGEALTAAIRTMRVQIVELLLFHARQQFDEDTLNKAFPKAIKEINDKRQRLQICALLMKAGVKGHVVSDALLVAAADGDTALGAALLQQGGASINHKDGKAVLEACRAGAVDVLVLLLNSPTAVKTKILARGFQAATQVGDLQKRADIFRLLLDKGVTGEVVDEQLISAAKFGNDGLALVKLLLEYGADVNYKKGEAVLTATRSAILGSLKLMLGVSGFAPPQKRPNAKTVGKVLEATWMLNPDSRYQIIAWVFAAGHTLGDAEINAMLIKTVKTNPDFRLVRLLLAQGASPTTNACECLIEASQKLLLDVLASLLDVNISAKDLTWTFGQVFTPATADIWLSEPGYEVASMLLSKGGNATGTALSTAIDAYGSDKEAMARKFTDLLTSFEVDVNHNDGLVLRNAAKRADAGLIRQLLASKPNRRTVSMAFPYIFQKRLAENEVLALIRLFTDYHDGEEGLDAIFAHPECAPVLSQAILTFSRSTLILRALLDAGFYHDQMLLYHVGLRKIDKEEPVSLLLWALLQPQKTVSDDVIELLVDRGANVNFQTSQSKSTPLMLAVAQGRQRIVRKLLAAGADVDVTDANENTPLSMVTKLSSNTRDSIMRDLLAVNPSINEGSLHDAARALDLNAVRALHEAGHELDFPSERHEGRSALAELVLHAADNGPITPDKEKAMVKVVSYLIANGTDVKLRDRAKKTVLLLAFDSADPVPTTRALLKVGMWKDLDKPDSYNNFTDDKSLVYSPTEYLRRLHPPFEDTTNLIDLLEKKRAVATFYALSGPQPPDAKNTPPEISAAERARQARLAAQAAEDEAHQRQIARRKESAAVEEQIFLRQTELEQFRDRQTLNLLRERDQVNEELFAAELRRQRENQSAKLRYETELGQISVRNKKLLGDAESEVAAKRQREMLEWERKVGEEKFGQQKAMSTLRIGERKEIYAYDERQSKNAVAKIEAQRKLVERQDALAARLQGAGAGVNPRQLGWVEELS